jgi:hypothetical protein
MNKDLQLGHIVFSLYFTIQGINVNLLLFPFTDHIFSHSNLNPYAPPKIYCMFAMGGVSFIMVRLLLKYGR